MGTDKDTPAGLRMVFERRLLELPQVTLKPWKETELICVFFGNKEFAHFHGQTILDLRLSVKIIREEQLSRDVSARIHPNRSQNSRWICFELKSPADVDRLLHLVQRACDELS